MRHGDERRRSSAQMATGTTKEPACDSQSGEGPGSETPGRAGGKMTCVTLPSVRVAAPVYKVRHTFKICNFDKLIRLAEVGSSFDSPEFCHPDAPAVKWAIRLFPAGEEEEDAGHVSAYVSLRHRPSLRAAYTLSSGLFVSRSGAAFFDREDAYTLGWRKFLPHSELGLGKTGVFAVTATVEYVYGMPKAQASVPEPLPTAMLFSEVLFSQDLSDFTLEVEGETIPVHKVLLATASPVFRAMFAQKDTAEARGGTAVLKDTSVAAVKLMLRFVYTGELQEAKPKSQGRKKPGLGELCEALGLAGRYDVAELGEAAEAALAKSFLRPASLLRVAAAADLHGFPRLFRLCREAVQSGRVKLGSLEEETKRHPAEILLKLTYPG